MLWQLWLVSCFAVITVGHSLHLHHQRSNVDGEMNNRTYGILTQQLVRVTVNNSSDFSAPLRLRGVVTMAESSSTEVYLQEHPIRHSRHRERHRHNVTSPSVTHNTTTPPSQPSRGNTSVDISMVSVGSHSNCYNANEVLEIIAFTCLVNFVFWSIILMCVHLHTSKHTHKSNSCDSLVSCEEAGVTYEPVASSPKCPSWRNVERYLESLPVEALHREMQFIHPLLQGVDGRSDKSLNITAEMISMDNLHPHYDRWRNDRKFQRVSLSMENLLF